MQRVQRVQKGCHTLDLKITAWPSCDTWVSLWFKNTNMELEAPWSHLTTRAAWNKRIQGILIYKYIWQLTNKHCSLNVWYRTLVIKLTYHWVTSIVEHLHWLKWKEAQKQVWQKTLTYFTHLDFDYSLISLVKDSIYLLYKYSVALLMQWNASIINISVSVTQSYVQFLQHEKQYSDKHKITMVQCAALLRSHK